MPYYSCYICYEWFLRGRKSGGARERAGQPRTLVPPLRSAVRRLLAPRGGKVIGVVYRRPRARKSMLKCFAPPTAAAAPRRRDRTRGTNSRPSTDGGAAVRRRCWGLLTGWWSCYSRIHSTREVERSYLVFHVPGSLLKGSAMYEKAAAVGIWSSSCTCVCLFRDSSFRLPCISGKKLALRWSKPGPDVSW